MKKKMAIVLSITVIAAMLLSACGKTKEIITSVSSSAKARQSRKAKSRLYIL